MRWFSKFRGKAGEDTSPTPISEEALTIYESAKDALGEARQRKEEVRQVSASLAGLRARNHFGESFERAMLKGGGTA